MSGQDEQILHCDWLSDHSNESYRAVLSRGTVDSAAKRASNFKACVTIQNSITEVTWLTG